MDDGREVASAPPAGESGKAPRDLRQEITDRMVAALGEGRIPWEKPWQSLDHGLPRNVASGREYQGGNRLILMLEQMDRGYADSRFGTMKQINELGGRVKKGERGIPVELWKNQPFWERRDVTVTAAYGQRVKVFGEERGKVLAGSYSDKEPTLHLNPDDLRVVHHPSGKPEQTMSWKDAHRLDAMVGRVFTVFNAEQTEGLKIEPLPKAEPRFDVVGRGEGLKVAMERDGLKFSEHPKFAFYSPKRDEVALPPRGQFQDEKGYYGTLLHEIGHATGAEKRLNREGITGNHRFGSEGYAKEELRAELFSVFMAGQTGIPHDETQHKAYIQSWAEALKKDKNEIFRAAAEASKAVDYVLAKEQDLAKAMEQTMAVRQEIGLEEGAGNSTVAVSPQQAAQGKDGKRADDRGTAKAADLVLTDSGDPGLVQVSGATPAGRAYVQGYAGSELAVSFSIRGEAIQRFEQDANKAGLAVAWGRPPEEVLRKQWIGERVKFAPHKYPEDPLSPPPTSGMVVDVSKTTTGNLRFRIRTDEVSPTDGKPLERLVYSNQGRIEPDRQPWGNRPEFAKIVALGEGQGKDGVPQKGIASKRAVDLQPGDRIVERIPGQAAFVDTVSDVRAVRDGKVHVDLNNDTATRIYDETERVSVMAGRQALQSDRGSGQDKSSANEDRKAPKVDARRDEAPEPPEKPEPERQAPPRSSSRRKSRGMER